jgi:hypothetical protein
MPPYLKKLVLVPNSGLCNRLRAIASARRLCRQFQAHCIIVWKGGNFYNFFSPAPDFEIVRVRPFKVQQREIHLPQEQNPCRAVDVNVASVLLNSGYLFWGSHESRITIKDVAPFLPSVHPRLMNSVEAFFCTHLENAVGFHIRRADSRKSTEGSPDCMFDQCARELIDQGKKIFLATDNMVTEQRMKEIFKDKIIVYPKRGHMEHRWPRNFNKDATEDDLIDLLLLAKTEFVIGSYWSSFSGIAIALNGSPRCKILSAKTAPAAMPSALLQQDW